MGNGTYLVPTNLSASGRGWRGGRGWLGVAGSGRATASHLRWTPPSGNLRQSRPLPPKIHCGSQVACMPRWRSSGHSSGRPRTRSERWRGARRRRRPRSWLSLGDAARRARPLQFMKRPMALLPDGALETAARWSKKRRRRSHRRGRLATRRGVTERERRHNPGWRRREASRHRSGWILSLPLQCVELFLLGNGTYLVSTRKSKREWPGLAGWPGVAGRRRWWPRHSASPLGVASPNESVAQSGLTSPRSFSAPFWTGPQPSARVR
jgi:hypothetical protein